MEQQPTVFIYTLTNPITNVLYYVGQTKDLKARVGGHGIFSEKDGITYKHYKPIIEVLDTCHREERFRVEAYWIDQLRAWGFPLQNSINKKPGTGYKKPMRGKLTDREIDDILSSWGF